MANTGGDTAEEKGTAKKPKEVKTWEEFKKQAEIQDNYIKFPEGGGIIDMSGKEPFTSTAVTIKAKEIQGNGWTIRGLSMRSSSSSSSSSRLIRGNGSSDKDYPQIYDLSITDVAIEEYGALFESTAKLHFHGKDADHPCRITLDCTSGESRAYSNVNMGAINGGICSITVNLNGANAQAMAGGKYNNCNIKLTGKGSGSNTAKLCSGSFNHCYFSGDVTVTDNTNGYVIDLSSGSGSTSNVIDLAVHSTATEKKITFESSGNSTGGKNLLNMDKLDKKDEDKDHRNVTADDKYFIKVHENEMTDEAGLKAKDFAIGDEEETN